MKKRTSGFTMIELIMVVTIVGALASIAIPEYANLVEKARAVEALDYISAIKKAEMAYASVHGHCTADLSELGMASETPLWTYEVGEASLLVIYARRKDDPGEPRYICFVYEQMEGVHLWFGDHPGCPKT